MATLGVFGAVAGLGLLGSAGVEALRNRSPRMTASAWMTVLPPRMMCCVPWIWDRREILLPVSCGLLVSGLFCLGFEWFEGVESVDEGGCSRFQCIRSLRPLVEAFSKQSSKFPVVGGHNGVVDDQITSG
jgi:hypothetical protein